MQGDTFVEKRKKLARYFNVPYPFKSAKKDRKQKPQQNRKPLCRLSGRNLKRGKNRNRNLRPNNTQPQTKQPQPQTAVKQPQPQAKQQPQPQIKQAQQKPQPQQVKHPQPKHLVHLLLSLSLSQKNKSFPNRKHPNRFISTMSRLYHASMKKCCPNTANFWMTTNTISNAK